MDEKLIELILWLRQPRHSQTELAAAIGVSQGRVSQWLKDGIVPHKRVRAVSEHTGIPAGRLNPDFEATE